MESMESASRDDRSIGGFATRSVETVWQLACGGVQCRPSSRHLVCIQTLQSREIISTYAMRRPSS